MIIIPAIDIMGGQVVRLRQGKAEDVTVYSPDPVAVAQKWEVEGAQRLHVVDLDGALNGTLKNMDLVIDIAKTIKIPVQMGGGIRTREEIGKLLSNGVSKVILGTKVVENREFLSDVLNQWGDKIIVSIDCSNGMVAQKGWTAGSDLKGTDFAKELEGLGLKSLVYTDISRDGTLSGPNFDAIEELLNIVNISVIASGGISTMDDIRRLCKLTSQGLIGAITGKAVYDGKIDLKEAIALCSANG